MIHYNMIIVLVHPFSVRASDLPFSLALGGTTTTTTTTATTTTTTNNNNNNNTNNNKCYYHRYTWVALLV